MSEQEISKAIDENRLFKIGDSFLFAMQIPDNSVGCSGSRCSYCEGKVAYSHQVCKHCNFPFIGPFGFPQISDWNKLSSERKWQKVREVYSGDSNYGRLTWVNVLHFPLRPSEMRKVGNQDYHRFVEYFCDTHFV